MTTTYDKTKVPAVAELYKQIFEVLGFDTQSEHLKDTPNRVAKWWLEFLDYYPGKIDTTFTSTNQLGQMVIVKDIKVWSLCAHHLLPFSTVFTVGYITNNKMLGLSKIARVAHMHAHKPQVQEQLTEDIATTIQKLTGSMGVAVVGTGRHLCMEMRGIKSPSDMVTSIMRGAFFEKPEARAEFLALINL